MLSPSTCVLGVCEETGVSSRDVESTLRWRKLHNSCTWRMRDG